MRDVPSVKLARADGARVIPGYLGGKTFGLRGALVSGSDVVSTGAGELRDQLDVLRAAVASGPTTFQTHDDRFYQGAQVSNFEESYGESNFGRWVEIALEVVCGDPYAYEFAGHTATLAVTASGQTLAVNNAANAAALPTIAVVFAGAGTVAATISNQTTGEAFTLTGGVAAGDVVAVNSQKKTVTRTTDGADRFLLFDGLFPRLVPGANTFSVQYLAGGDAVTGLNISWVNRWY